MPEYMICRICLTEDMNADTMTPLFDDQDVQCPLVHLLEEIGSIKVLPDKSANKYISINYLLQLLKL